MKKGEKIYVTLYVVVLIFTSSCGNKVRTSKYLREQLWQYESGFKVDENDGFCLQTNKNLRVSGDTIYSNGRDVGVIIKVDSINHVLEIESIPAKEKGVYYSTKANL